MIQTKRQMKHQKNKTKLEVYNISKSFGRVKILNEVSFNINNSEIVLLTGQNGSGKSTLLKIIASLIHPDNGTIKLFGEKSPSKPEYTRTQIGCLLHDNMLYSDLTIRENLEFVAGLFGIENICKTVNDIGTTFELSRIMDTRIRYLSHGQARRAAIAKTFIHKPKLLLLDEPESGLDTISLELLHKETNRLRSTGTTVLMTSHSFDTTNNICDRVIILSNSKIICDKNLNEISSSEINDLISKRSTGQ